MASRDTATAERLRWRVALACQSSPPTAVARRFGVTRFFARYWGRKWRDPTFRPGTWGGARNHLYSEAEELLLSFALWEELRADPLRTIDQLRDALVSCALCLSS